MTMDTPPDIPFVGLRPFESHERLLFFGRNMQVAELLQRLRHNGFVVVVGDTGSGKSSLVRAGLIPKLKDGFLVEGRKRWYIATMKPGHMPLSNLAAAILSVEGENHSPRDIAALREDIEARGIQAILDQLALLLPDTNANILLLVDQFEEIFRSTEQTDSDTRYVEATDFVQIILELAEQRPLYVVMTIRLDFLGDCDIFYNLPETINRSNYFVSRLSRGELKEAIKGPIHLVGATINNILVERLLNDAERNRVPLPVIQHALMRIWQAWKQNGQSRINLEHYESSGAMTQALSQHADEAWIVMDEEPRRLTELLFRALTEIDAKKRRKHRPAPLSEIEAITGARRDQILEIVEQFPSSGQSFLVLSKNYRGDDPELRISHESLILQWSTLQTWVAKEADSRDMYLRLARAETLYAAGITGLLGGPDLQFALDWREANQPTAAWAKRYDPNQDATLRFANVMYFLEKSLGESEQPKKHEIVISYSREDRKFVLAMANSLLEMGRKVWIDEINIRAGMNWAMAIHEAITNCDCFLIILTPSSFASDVVSKELDLALDKKKPVIPVLLKKGEIPLRLRGTQYIDFTNNRKRALSKLVKTLKDTLDS